MKSTATLPQFTIFWRETVELGRALVSGMTEEEAEQAVRNGRPMVVLIYDADEPDARRELEEGAFKDEEVAIAARFFDCLRMSADAAAEDRVAKEAGTRAPRLLFLRPNFEVVKVLQGRVSARQVVEAMGRTIKADYENSLAAAAKAQKDLFKERTALETEREKLQRLEERMGKEPSAARRAPLVKERDALQEQIAKLERALDEREQALYLLKPKLA
ncbi:MAG: hypothetical protein ACT4PV_09145 [Planctomycetaceae bacterium]